MKLGTGSQSVATPTEPSEPMAGVDPPERPSGEIVLGDHPELQRALGQPQALFVLRQVAQLELPEQRPHVHLHGIDTEEHLVGDLAVGGRAAKLARRGRGGTGR